MNVFLGLGLPWTVAAVPGMPSSVLLRKALRIWAVRGQTAEWLSLYHDGSFNLLLKDF